MLLRQMQGLTPNIEASAIVSSEGLVLASALPSGTDEQEIGAMSAAVLTLGERIARELLSGRVKQVYVEGQGTGYVFLTSIGEDAILVALANPDAKLALVFMDMGRIASEAKAILQEDVLAEAPTG
ncbi:MAG: roadblock/LC7 domain-containing protein [Anaerolineae bacterium]|nr:roadblock/LC7 domain-containing protein [Anaerolineae bacterium]